MRHSEAWMLQARSDLDAGHAVFTVSDHGTYCQAIANFQQVVEKSIKSMIAAQIENGIEVVNIGSDHYPEKQIDALLLIKRAVSHELLSHIHSIFSGHRLGEFRALCLLAPRLPPRRNTEYPYPDDAGGWTAPAAEGSFNAAEVYRFRSLADEIAPLVGRFVQAARLSLKR